MVFKVKINREISFTHKTKLILRESLFGSVKNCDNSSISKSVFSRIAKIYINKAKHTNYLLCTKFIKSVIRITVRCMNLFKRVPLLIKE